MINGPKYAVSLTAMLELTRLPENLPLFLLLKSLVTEDVVFPDKERSWAHQGLVLSGEVDGERWQAIVKLIRKKFRYPEFPLYEKGERGWKKVK